MGNIIMVIAVLLIHMERKAAADIRPSIMRLGLTSTNWIMCSAIRLCSCHCCHSQGGYWHAIAGNGSSKNSTNNNGPRNRPIVCLVMSVCTGSAALIYGSLDQIKVIIGLCYFGDGKRISSCPIIFYIRVGLHYATNILEGHAHGVIQS